MAETALLPDYLKRSSQRVTWDWNNFTSRSSASQNTLSPEWYFYSWLPELFLNNLRVSNWQPFMALVVLACRTVRGHGSGNREVSLWECSHAHVTVSNKRTTNTGRLHPRHATTRSQFPDEIRYAWLHSYVELSPGLIAVVCVHW